MPILWLLLTVMFIFASLFHTIQTDIRQDIAVSEVEFLTSSVLLYRNLVVNYADANSTTNGTISDAALVLPSWYRKPPSLTNYVLAGKSYVFFTEPLPGLAGQLAHKTESMNVGINQGGFLSSPNSVSNGLPLPGQIPNGAVVVVQ